jgi:hypothetical protein
VASGGHKPSARGDFSRVGPKQCSASRKLHACPPILAIHAATWVGEVTKPVHFFIPVSVSLHLLFDVAQKEFVVEHIHSSLFLFCVALTSARVSNNFALRASAREKGTAARSLLDFFNKSATHANKKRAPSAKECERAALFCHRSARLASIAFHSCSPGPFHHFPPLQKAESRWQGVRVPSAPN